MLSLRTAIDGCSSAVRSDGVPPKEGKCIIFPSFEAVLESFATREPDATLTKIAAHLTALVLLKQNRVYSLRPNWSP